jgi:hypothetical protein
MKILPPVFRLPPSPLQRRYRPPYRGYSRYLRWEFGFTCAFCFLHETDFSSWGEAQFCVEHFVPRSRLGVRADAYENLFYTCRYCNSARGSAPVVDHRGRRLLNPCTSAWGTHFIVDGDMLLPGKDDYDAAYTADVYDVNEPRKVEMRKLRREVITEGLQFLSVGFTTYERLLERVCEEAAAEYLDAARGLAHGISLAQQDLAQFSAIPLDARDSNGGLSLPAWLDEQTIELRELVRRVGLSDQASNVGSNSS